MAFVALLLLTGVIGFLLGLAREHPFQATYRAARRDRDRPRAVHDDGNELRESHRRTEEQITRQLIQQWENEEAAIRAAYRDAALACSTPATSSPN